MLPQTRPRPLPAAPLAARPVLHTRSLDDLHELVTAMAAPHERRQLEGGALTCRVNGAAVGPASLHWVSYDRRMRVEAPPEFNRCFVHLHRRPAGTYGFADGPVAATPGRAVLIVPGQPYELDARGMDCLVLGLDRRALAAEIALRCGGAVPPAVACRRTLDTGLADARIVLDLAATLRSALEQAGPGFLDRPEAQRSFGQALVGAVVNAFLDREAASAGAGSPTARALAALADCVEAHHEEPLTLGDLCAASGLGARTLQRACQARWGLSPMAYLARRRLDAARARLLVPGRGTTVSDVALACGFFHLGRFAEAYRKRFGEPPSRTLAEARGRTRG